MKTYTYQCDICGREFETQTYKGRGRRRCIECGVARVRQAVIDLHAHQGEFYERWKAACIAKADRYIKGIQGGEHEATQSKPEQNHGA